MLSNKSCGTIFMHRNIKIILTGILLIILFLAGCVSTVFVDYDHEAATKFVAYKCFTVDTADSTEASEDLVFSPIAYRRFEHAIKIGLKERGYDSDCSEVDFIVRFHAAKRTINEIDFFNNVHPLRPYYPSFYPDAGFFPPPYIDRYDEGIFVIDIIDAQSEELVWRGTYTERIGRRPHDNEEVCILINRILERFSPLEIREP